MTGTVLRLRQVCKSYRLGPHLIEALREVDLDAQEGELLALTGPSGSGKSTLLNIAGLIDSPDSGEVVLMGRSMAGLSPAETTTVRRDAIGFIFQSFNLVPVMTVAENVDFPLLLMGLSAAERKSRVERILEEVGLQDHARHRPDLLSGGQRQRVAIARALVKRPRFVIADEPTASLDSTTAEQVLVLMRQQAHALRTSFLVASHDARLVRHCDRVLTLRDGLMVEPTDDHFKVS